MHCSPEVTGCGAFFSLCTFMEMSIEARVSSFTNLILIKKMKTNIYYVVSQTEASYVASQKAEGGQLAKCVIRLKEFGGSKFGNEYACTIFGNLAQCKFYEGDLVAASLRFQVHEVNGAVYQEVIANDVVKLLNC